MSTRPLALVTGATAGIGNAFARALAERGHDLVIVARDQARLADVAEQLRGRGGAVEVLAADLSDRDQLEAVAHRLRAAGADGGPAPVDVLVSNAGFGLRQRFVDGDLAAEEALLDVLVRAVLVLTHAAVPVMVARGRGQVITVSSIAGYLRGGTYSAAKAWATTFTVSLNDELAGTGVRATALCPGLVRTEFHQRMRARPYAVPSWAWLDADRLVAECLDDVARGRAVSVPGRFYPGFALLARHAPAGISRLVNPRRSGRPSRP